jgi:hypothetical protein
LSPHDTARQPNARSASTTTGCPLGHSSFTIFGPATCLREFYYTQSTHTHPPKLAKFVRTHGIHQPVVRQHQRMVGARNHKTVRF